MWWWQIGVVMGWAGIRGGGAGVCKGLPGVEVLTELTLGGDAVGRGGRTYVM